VIRSRLLGAWGQFFGPGASVAENAGSVIIGLVAAGVAWVELGLSMPGASTLQHVVAAALALELVAGTWTNATPSARRWHHRAGQGRIEHLGFSVAHVHPFIVAGLFEDCTLQWAAMLYVTVAVGTMGLSLVPTRLRTAAALVLIAAALGAEAWLAGEVLRWFAPAYLLKLLAAHLLPEIPGQSGRDTDREMSSGRAG
jgi:uncharacterized membrane protein YhaH (DUF805 family)